MMYKQHIPALLASVLLGGAGCLGGELTLSDGSGAPNNNPATGGTAQEQFESTVRPILAANCAGTGCHEGTGSPSKFLGAAGDPSDDYQAMVAQTVAHGGFNSASAALITKVELGNHFNTSYSAEQKAAIVAWLDAEKLAAGGDGGNDPVPVSGDPLAAWAGCMNIANWNAANMGNWANKQTNNDGPCSACHQDGLARFFTNNNNNSMYNQNRTALGIISFFTVETANDGSMTVVAAMDKLYRMGDGTTLHPEYNLDDQYFGYLTDFVERTRQTKAEGDCFTPGYYTE